MTHPSVNGPRLLALADEIENPTRGLGFNMHWWQERTNHIMKDIEGDESCGTVCCIGGTVCEMLSIDNDKRDSGRMDLAGKALGLLPAQYNKLFYPNNDWAWEVTRTQAAKVIRHLAKTGEVDWSVAQ